jgi:hypothetical protein
MARPEKHTVDYFPFYVKDGKTLFILESKYGCKGTGFFTNVIRFLCSTPDHHCCIKDESDRMYFFSKVKCDEESGLDMLNIMAKSGKIHSHLWVSGSVIASSDVLDSIKDAYDKRLNPIITIIQIEQKYVSDTGNSQVSELTTSETQHNRRINSPDNTQTKLNKTKLKNKRALCVYSDAFQSFWNSYPKKTAKKGAFAEWNKAEDTGQLPSIDAILSAIENQKRARQKAHDTGQFTSEWPDPERWIKKARWEDDPEALIGKQGGNGNKPPPGKTYQSTVIADPFTVCPKCNSEVLKSNFIEINGERYCSKCPEVAEQAKKTLSKLTEMAQGIGGKV